MWKHGHFGWEYKGKRKDLNAAFVQLQQRPAWRVNAPAALDRAVAAAYGWPEDIATDYALERLLALNLERAKLSG